MRKARYAGSFYPSFAESIKETLEKLEKADKKESAKGIIIPHAGWIYSGETANITISRIKQEFDTIIIFGTDHTGAGSCISLDDFSNPLGKLSNDKELSKEISKKIKINGEAHNQEHSIEVILPFLQTYFNNFKIVPIIVGSAGIEELKKVAEIIYSAIAKLKRKVLVVASSDFIHYGENYGFFLKKGWEEAEKIDKSAIKEIEKLDSQKFLDIARNTTICGSGAISLCIELCKLFGAIKGKLVDYKNSAAVSGDFSSVVGYAGVLIN